MGGAGRSPHPLLRPSTLTVGQQHVMEPSKFSSLQTGSLPPPASSGLPTGQLWPPERCLSAPLTCMEMHHNVQQVEQVAEVVQGQPEQQVPLLQFREAEPGKDRRCVKASTPPHHHSSSASTRGRDLGSGHAPSLPLWLSRPLHSATPPSPHKGLSPALPSWAAPHKGPPAPGRSPLPSSPPEGLLHL